MHVIELKRPCPFCRGPVRLEVSQKFAALDHVEITLNPFCRLVGLHCVAVGKVQETINQWDENPDMMRPPRQWHRCNQCGEEWSQPHCPRCTFEAEEAMSERTIGYTLTLAGLWRDVAECWTAQARRSGNLADEATRTGHPEVRAAMEKERERALESAARAFDKAIELEGVAR